MSKKRAPKAVESRYIVIAAPYGKKDTEGQKRITWARDDLERDGFRVTSAGKLPSGRNYMIEGQRPLR